MSDFMSDWLGKSKKGRAVDPNKLSRYGIKNDVYDRQDLQRMMKEIPEFKGMREKLSDSKAGDLAYDVWQDIYSAFWKVEPEIEDESKVRPTHLVNRRVDQEMQDLPEFRNLRAWTQGDDIGSALACNTIEPDIETIYDRLDEEQKLAEQLMDQMQQMSAAQQEQRDLEEMMKEWTEDPENNPEPKDYSEQMRQMQEKIDELQERMKATGQSLDEALNGAAPGIRSALRKAIEQAAKDLENQSNMADSWGMEPGALHRLPANERLALARRLNTEKFKRIAELFGPMKRLAFSENRRKVNYAPEEVYDVEMGNNLRRILPSELGKLSHPLRRKQFFKDYLNHNLLQYKLRGYEKVAKGGIIFCHDGSGSMAGEPEMWAKAFGLCLLHIARKQNRSFYAIQFGSPRQIRIDDFRDTKNITPDQVIDFAEYFMGGGTDFMCPLDHAVELLQAEHARFGAVKADIVFVTDGQCAVSDPWLKTFKETQDKLGFKVWGCSIGGSPRDEPLAAICNGQVATIKSLTNGENVRAVFGGV